MWKQSNIKSPVERIKWDKLPKGCTELNCTNPAAHRRGWSHRCDNRLTPLATGYILQSDSWQGAVEGTKWKHSELGWAIPFVKGNAVLWIKERTST